MTDHTKDINALIEFLATASQEPFYYTATHNAEKYHAALTALVAERDSLRAEIAAAYRDRASSKSVLASVIAERDALKRRVAELEAHPPADRDRDLRERLVCAALTGVCADPNMNDPDIARFAGDIADAAVAIADATLAAMRKGEA